MATRRQLAGLRKVGQLRRVFRRLPKETTAEVREAMRSAAGMLLREALRRVPRKTGALARELRFVMSRDGLSAKVGIVGKRAKRRSFYGRMIEFGTVKMPARPFLLPAAETVRPKMAKIVNAAVLRAIAKAVRGSAD